MGLAILMALAGILLAGAVVFGWVVIATHRRPGGHLLRHDRDVEIDRVVATECADLDAEYQRLLTR